MAATVPDVIVKLVQIGVFEARKHVHRAFGIGHPQTIEWRGRAEALETSFSAALARMCDGTSAGARSLCGDGNVPTTLDSPFASHWSPDRSAPALILNTTWAETGERIAFSPFSLAEIGDGTLRAMDDLQARQPDTTLIRAAVVSARFPAVMPAQILHPDDRPRLWWNFVDGGYADASGTTTALELYQALARNQKGITDRTGIAFELKLLILSEPGLVGKDATRSGDGLIHAISPITTLLTIREQIGRRAVARALKELTSEAPQSVSQNGAPTTGCGSSRPWKVRTITLDARGLQLPLGWMLSRHTVDAIDRTIARAASKAAQPSRTEPKDPNVDTFRAIYESLDPSCGAPS